MIDITENEDGSITYESVDGIVVGRRVGELAVRLEPFNSNDKVKCRHCDRELTPLGKIYVVDVLLTGQRGMPARSFASAMVVADSMSLAGPNNYNTPEIMAWMCEQDLREVLDGTTFTPLRQWRRERDEASNSDPKMRL